MQLVKLRRLSKHELPKPTSPTCSCRGRRRPAAGVARRVQREGSGRDASVLLMLQRDCMISMLAIRNQSFPAIPDARPCTQPPHGASGVKLYPGSANAHDRRNGVPGV
eukprot:scaffold84754_cov37-Phaeocystis_antarctica.AAC.1